MASRRRRRAAPAQHAPPQQQHPGQPAVPKKKGPPKFLDAHVRVGLEDILVRIPTKDWQIVLINWMLGREDIILRGRYSNQETNIILRGSDSGALTVRAPQPRNKVPVYRVVRAIDERMRFLEGVGA